MKAEYDRQRRNIELIASENFVSEAVLAAASSVLTNKYAEGYPGKRYYGGCECVDVVENIARDRAKALFGADHVNVQPTAALPPTMPSTSPVQRGGHGAGHEPGQRRPPHPRQPGELLRPELQHRPLRCGSEDPPHRL